MKDSCCITVRVCGTFLRLLGLCTDLIGVMESELVPKERRGRKRRRKDVHNGLLEGKDAKKAAVETKNLGVEPRLALVGRYVKKEFDGRVFLGKVVYYDTGLYRIDYEDGDCEDLESGEIRELLVRDEEFDHKFLLKKKKLDGLVSKKYAKGKDLPKRKEVESAIVDIAADRVEASSLNGVNGVDGLQVEDDADSSSYFSESSCDRDMSSEAEASLVPPPQLPPSSGNIGVSEEHVSHLLSVYSFLRSFSIGLYLSPFGLDEFVGSLNCSVPNTLLDAIHVALMRALRRHLETLSSDVSELASKCLRYAYASSNNICIFIAKLTF